MKGISLLQPFASLIEVGAKGYETRSWKTDYRAPIAIHASFRFPAELRLLCEREHFRLHLPDWRELPLGKIVATARLVDCIPTVQVIEAINSQRTVGPHEELFGDFGAGRFAWQLVDVKRLAEPVPCHGRLGLWDVSPGILAAIEKALGRTGLGHLRPPGSSADKPLSPSSL